MRNEISFATAIFLFLITSCSGLTDKEGETPSILPQQNTLKDFKEHLIHLGNTYKKQEDLRGNILELPREHKKYLESLAKRILNNNELLLSSSSPISFYIINSKHPLHFSLPGNQIFLSNTLVNHYLKHEGLLIAIMAYEILKSQKNQYRKNLKVPTGGITTKELVQFLRIPMRNKLELNRWVFYTLKRSGHDPHLYLMWIQMQNKNAHEFLPLLGNFDSMAKEEFEFKNFISKQKTSSKIDEIKKNSSSGFYRFKRFVYQD